LTQTGSGGTLADNGGLDCGFLLEKRWISVGKSGDFHAISP
jgi:hypothetical protein